jgi:uncharacterized protein YndB with AHSA1/START domain
MDGTVERLEEGFVLRFERRLPHPLPTVRDALTQAPRISEWLGGPGSEIDLRVGGRVWLGAHKVESTIVALEPPRLIEFGWRSKDWDGGTIRWELSPENDGTTLLLTHNHPDITSEQERELTQRYGWGPEMIDTIPRTLAGWHTLLDQLSSVLAGEGRLPEDYWKGIHQHYLARV